MSPANPNHSPLSHLSNSWKRRRRRRNKPKTEKFSGEPAPMNQIVAARLCKLLLFLLSSHASSAQPSSPMDPSGTMNGDVAVSFKPSIAIVIGIFSIIFSLTFLLLMYAKFCTSARFLYNFDTPDGLRRDNPLVDADRAFSGLDKSVIEALPFFKFASLKGVREGLECAVCLSGFEDPEILRLLPKCKHAFHVDCVDRWLESHSSCPLCRHRVEVGDLTLFQYSTSSRFLFRDLPPATATAARAGETDLELIVEREPISEDGVRRIGSSSSSRFSVGKVAHQHPPETTLLPTSGGEHDFIDHRVVVGVGVFKNRWSDLNSADLTSLNSEMLSAISDRRFAAPSPGRSMSEITDAPRFVEPPGGRSVEEEETRRVWLHIARRTVQWLAGREKDHRRSSPASRV